MALFAPDALPDAAVPGIAPLIEEFARSRAYRRVKRAYDFVSATALLVDAEGRFLLQHRDDKPDIVNPGLWGSFGGRVEPYETDEAETPDEGFCASCEEELAWRPRHFELYTAGAVPLAARRGRRAASSCTSTPRRSMCRSRRLTLGEGQAMASFAPDALPEHIVPALRGAHRAVRAASRLYARDDAPATAREHRRLIRSIRYTVMLCPRRTRAIFAPEEHGGTTITCRAKMSAGVILVDAQGRVLLQLRDDNPKIMFPGHWGLTGGAANAGETPEQTARREVTRGDGPDARRASSRSGPTTSARRRRGAESAARDEAPRTTRCTSSTRRARRRWRRWCAARDASCASSRRTRSRRLDIAYNHREVLEDFFASPAYGLYLRGGPFGEDGDDGDRPAAQRSWPRSTPATPWFEALMQAIALWERAGGDGRRTRSTATSSAARRSTGCCWRNACIAEADGADPGGGRRAAALRRRRRSPGVQPASRIGDERLRELIGEAKHRAHLNYVYGVTVEEALQYAVELEVSKERGDRQHPRPALRRGCRATPSTSASTGGRARSCCARSARRRSGRTPRTSR